MTDDPDEMTWLRNDAFQLRGKVQVQARELQRAIAAVKAQHEAIDRLFAMLIERTGNDAQPFYPSQCGQPWEAIQMGKDVLDAAGAKV